MQTEIILGVVRPDTALIVDDEQHLRTYLEWRQRGGFEGGRYQVWMPAIELRWPQEDLTRLYHRR